VAKQPAPRKSQGGFRFIHVTANPKNMNDLLTFRHTNVQHTESTCVLAWGNEIKV